jgi:hypothetical protein
MHVCKIAKNDCYLRRVCLSVHMEQLGSNLMNFHQILLFEDFSNIYIYIYRTNRCILYV